MFVIISLLFIAWLSCQYEIISAFNCGSQTILNSPLVKYTSDQLYEGLTSKSSKKDFLPSKYIDPIDMQLLSTERTTEATSNSFSYYLRLKDPDNYLILFKFIEVVYQKASERVFQIKLGDEIIMEVDIFRQVGYGQVLHKWVQFQMKDEVIYINQTLPILNAYIYPKQQMKLTFSKVKSHPKIEALILVKGSDCTKFLNEYLKYEKWKNKDTKQYISQKYHKPPQFYYKHMTGNEIFHYPEQNLMYYLKKIISLNTLFSLIVVIFVVAHDKIFELFSKKNQTKKNE